ncbi:plasmid mobilization relaxosome protein MobC [Desulfosporosinus sp.]|uniref:plasmid mobilization protein n=1 Tax=Desulfosporosinus sp. TaxID=157907 RepID=UPI0023282244|nr:plasmid mobilization relaxosome protein MobC [Desulfosporosinus sp.]MDA8222503.1 plasmid mobilization relaxosome protein MobC [Desulfitobacterium hafniense]
MSEVGRLRDKKIQFWVTEIETDVINEKANYCGLSRSEYLRKVSIDGVIIKRDFEGLYEINKIGVNINQISKNANKRDMVIERDVEELRMQYEKLFEVVYGQIIDG